jgi:hemerythrin-like metal-binding protein
VPQIGTREAAIAVPSGDLREPLPWSESFAVGHSALDAEHRSMVGLINRFCRTRDADDRAHLLSELDAMTERHFEHEESVLEQLYLAAPKDRRKLRASLSTALIEHAGEHRRRLGEIRAMRGALGSDAAAGGATLCDELKAWFIDHAIGYEAQLKTVLQSL